MPAELTRQMEYLDSVLHSLGVRTRREWEKGHLENVVNIPITELRPKISTLYFDREQPVVAICISAHRIVPAIRLLRREGFQEVVQLAGGMLSWRDLELSEQS